MYQHWTGIGRMVEESPNLTYTSSGKALAKFTLAVDNGKKPDGDKDTLFANIVCWERLAESVANYGSKGRMCAVGGRWAQRSYDKDGQKRTAYEVHASVVRFLDRGNDQQHGNSMGTEMPTSSDDVPFAY